MNNEEYEEFQKNAIECERFFWYVKDHWDEYCKFCETHDPLEFEIPPKGGELMEKTIAYLVEFSKCKSVFSEYGDTVKEHWSKEVLAKRLLDIHYSIHSATMVILDEDAEIVKES